MSPRPLRRPSRSVLAVSVATAAAGLLVVTALPASAAPGDAALAAKIAKVMKDSRVTKARSTAVVRDGLTGAEVYQRNGSVALTPASNTKMVTAVAAMKTLGPSFQFRTEVVRRGAVANGRVNGNLYLKGYGDPTTRQSDFRTLAESVRRQGITAVSGALAVDVSYFDATRYNPTWSKTYADDYYAAEISPLTLAPNSDLDSGTVLVNYAPTTKGKKAKITFTPAAASRYVKVSNSATTGAKGSSTSISVTRSYGSNTVVVRGKVAAGRGTSSRLITVHQPALYAAAVFRSELERAGVSVAKSTKIMTIPASSRTVLARDYSMTLSALLVPFLKLSNNMHAEALTKTMAAETTGRPGSWSAGLAITKAYMSKLGAPMTGVSLSDGSGLTRANKLTGRALTRVLYAVQQESWFPFFRAALPVAGNTSRMVGGTLRYRMNNTRAANNARAKTGTLSGVTSLSGYVRDRDGRLLVFAMISNYTGSTPRPVENTFVITLANHRR